MAIAGAIITGTGMCVPDRVVTNEDLEKLMDTSDQWIVERSGIKERRHVEHKQTPSELAEVACRAAIKNAGLKTSDIDMIIVSTLSPEHYFPGTAFFLQRRLELAGVPCFDLHAQCSGFVYALDTAAQFVRSKAKKRVLVCGAELQSKGLDFSTRGRDTAVLFGDGAGACVVECTEEKERGVIDSVTHADGTFAEKLWVELPGMGAYPHISPDAVEAGKVYPQMEGRLVFKHAVTRLPEVVTEILQKNGLHTSDVDLFLFHQANLRINEMVAQTLRLNSNQVYNNIERYGNCSSASIPIAMHECIQSGKIKSGSIVCTAAFGSGFTWGANLIRF